MSMNSNTASVTNDETPRAFYQRRRSECQRRIESYERHSVQISRLRGLTFFTACGLALAGWVSNELSGTWYVGAGVSLAAFMVIAFFHEQLLADAGQMRERRKRCDMQTARLDRRWDRIATIDVPVPESYRSLANDLDLFGPASLFQLICMARTSQGKRMLRDWLLEPAKPEEILLRQKAARRLAANYDLRDELDLRGRMLGASQTGPQAFVEWAEGPAWLSRRPWLTWLSRLLTVSVLGLFVLGLAGLIEPFVLLVSLLCLIGVNTHVCALYTGTILSIFDNVSSRNNEIRHYWRLFELIAELEDESGFIERMRAGIGKTPREPLIRLQRLMKIMSVANLRRAGLLGIPYIASQLIVLTDFHLLACLETWQRQNGSFVRRWFDAVAQLEALSSLATLAHDHPHWTFPVIGKGEAALQAQAIGHPLLPDDTCVRNDVRIGPRGTFLLVTGSNMSGKSTLLRAVGINVALAQAGGPVCAAELCLPPLQIATSMRVHDSLADGVSFFMAELKRMKQIVDQSRALTNARERTLLYLLDEILQGTNSIERQIAVARIIGYLVAQGAIGAVSTHDLELAGVTDLAGACQTVHFRETIDSNNSRQQMTFDYQMRPGLAPTTNALKLLELVGLGG